MRFNNRLRTTVSASVVAACAFGFAGVAAAQDSGQNTQNRPTTIDDIVVTATKREQNLQDVPIVVTTLSQETLQNAGVRDIKDLQILTPGMTVTSTSSEASTTARIRGVGTVGDNPGLESSVGVVIDGVYRSRNSVGFGDLGELSRIEVLKGPQGTLFGKNTSAGVINIITEAPSFTRGVNAELTAGNFGAFGAAASVTGPISDQLAFRLYGAYRERDGWLPIDTGDGPRTNTRDYDQNFYTVRGQLLYLPNDSASIRVIADYSKRDEFCCTGIQLRSGPTAAFVDALSNGPGIAPAAANNAALPFNRQGYTNRDDNQRIEDRGISAEANVDTGLLGGSTLTSITSWRYWESNLGQDIDYSGADIAYRVADGGNGYDVENVTQELRLAGSTEHFDWLVGFFGTGEQIGRRDNFFFGADYTPFLSYLITANLNRATAATPTPPGPVPISPNRIGCFTATGQTTAGLQGCLYGAVPATGPGFIVGQAYADTYNQKTTSFAFFTDNTFHLTDKLDLTFGVRFTMDDKSLRGRQRNTNGNGATCAAAIGNQAAIAGAVGASNVGGILGALCLPFANVQFNDRAIIEDHDDGEFSGTAKAAYRFSDEVMAYASYARGYKSFGYNMDRVQVTGTINPAGSLFFPSETVDSYEAGVKTTLLQRSLLLNATYFYQRFENFQLNTFNGVGFTVEPIPELTTKGVDADMFWFTPLEGLTLQGGVTYTDAEYGRFTAANLLVPANFPNASLLPGNRPSFAPEWSGSLAVNYDRSIGNGLRAGFSLAGKYMSEYNTGSDLLPFKIQDAYTTLNGRITVGSEDERWALELWGQNLTDEEYIQVGYNAPLQGTAFQSTVNTSGQYAGTFYNPAADTQTYDAFPGAPRMYGATLRVKY